jgi:transposase
MKATLKRLGIRRFNQRTALINQLRAILLERGNVGPQRKRKLEQYLLALLDEQDGKGLTPRMRTSIADLRAQWLEVDRRIAGFDEEFARFTHENEPARRLATASSVGVGDRAQTFARGRGSGSFHVNRRPTAGRGSLPSARRQQILA